MWCPHCIREVSPSPGGSAPAVCPLCGRAVEAVTRQSQAVRQAREILERWQASDLFERITSSDVIPEHKKQTREAPARLPQPERSHAIDFTTTPAAIPADVGTTKTSTPPRLNPPPSIPSAIQPNVRPVSRSVIRELPQLPFDLLAPAPVVAAAAESREPAPASSQTPPEVVNGPKISSPADWEPPPRTDDSLSNEDAAPQVTPPAADPTELSIPVQPAADHDSDAEIAAFFESSASGFFSEANDSQPEASAGKSDRGQKIEPLTEAKINQVEAQREAAPAPAQSSAVPTPSSAVPFHEQQSAADSASEPTPMESGIPTNSEAVESSEASESPDAAAVDEAAPAPVILPAQPRRSRPALQRPSLVRRSPGQSETVPSHSGTIPMNRNQNGDPASSGQPQPAAPAIVSNSPDAGVRERRDHAEATINSLQSSSRGRSGQRYIDEPHGSGVRGPHFEVNPPPRSNITTIIGQALAYIGVVSLLIGTSLVILGHFGGETEYTPTGWLITTVAQMLLFLGIINLVSGGMEQHNDEVARRIHSLSEHLIRIEQTTAEALREVRNPEVVQRQEQAEIVTAGDRRQA